MTNTGDWKYYKNMDILKAFELYQAQQVAVKTIEPRNEYRLYFSANEQQVAVGPPWPALDWQYISISAEQAANLGRYRLVNGQLELVDIGRLGSVKYKESATGEFTVAADHLALLVESGEEYHAVKRVTADFDRYSRPRHNLSHL